MSTTRGFFPVVFKANADQGLLDVDPADCQLRVIIKKNDEGRYYFDAEVVDVANGGSDAWYAFMDFACCPDAFEAIGFDVPSCARFDGASWSFDSLLAAIVWAKHFAMNGLGVEQ